MLLKLLTSRYAKWGLLIGTATFAILPGGCETKILRLVTPLLL